MTIQEQIQWAEKQLRYSAMIDDGDADRWQAILDSLNKLQRLTDPSLYSKIEDIIYDKIEVGYDGSLNGKWDSIEAICNLLKAP